MRTSVTSVTGKCVAAVAVLAVAVVGWSFGDDPKAQPIRPAAATVAVEDKPSSQLILTFREDVRFLTPTGKELQRIDYSAAKKADPELLTGTVTIGTGQFMKIERYLPSFGRAGPGGVVPLSSHGMKLMMPGTPPTIKLLDETVPGDLVIGWTADGKDFFTQGVEDASLVWGVTGYKTMKVDATTGQRESLPFGKEYLVFDVSADGKHFLAARFKERPLGLPGFTNEACDLCVLTAAGEAKTLAKSWASKFDMRTRISPDGTRTAAVMAAKDQPTRVGISTFPKKGEVATEIVDLPGVEAKVECTGVAWSPDGKQIVSSWRNESWKKEQTWYVAVCDANGKNMRQVTTFEMKNDEQLRALDWR